MSEIERDGYAEEIKRLRHALKRSLALIEGMKDLSAKAEPKGYRITTEDWFTLSREAAYIRDTLGNSEDTDH